jgi:hypothetical protein
LEAFGELFLKFHVFFPFNYVNYIFLSMKFTKKYHLHRAARKLPNQMGKCGGDVDFSICGPTHLDKNGRISFLAAGDALTILYGM